MGPHARRPRRGRGRERALELIECGVRALHDLRASLARVGGLWMPSRCEPPVVGATPPRYMNIRRANPCHRVPSFGYDHPHTARVDCRGPPSYAMPSRLRRRSTRSSPPIPLPSMASQPPVALLCRLLCRARRGRCDCDANTPLRTSSRQTTSRVPSCVGIRLHACVDGVTPTSRSAPPSSTTRAPGVGSLTRSDARRRRCLVNAGARLRARPTDPTMLACRWICTPLGRIGRECISSRPRRYQQGYDMNHPLAGDG